jgi:hypothetical protein
VRSFATYQPVTFKPSIVAPQKPIEIHTLTPTFKWRQPNPSEKADFAIWIAEKNGTPGQLIDHAETISGCQYTVQVRLWPNTIYIWSVRPTGSYRWSTMKYTAAYVIPTPVVGVGGWWVRNGIPFKIATMLPGQ